MTWFFAFLIVAVLGVVAVVASGRGGSMAEVYDDRPDSRVQADGPLSAADIRGVRFSTAFRGYRMSEVDALLDRLAAELDGLRVGPLEFDDTSASSGGGGTAVPAAGSDPVDHQTVDREAGLGWPEASGPAGASGPATPGAAASGPATSGSATAGPAAPGPAASRPRPGEGPVRRPPAKKDPDSVLPQHRSGGEGS